MTQQEVARRVRVRANYVGYLERDMRRPSTAVLVRLARVLELDREELFFLAHPQVRTFMQAPTANANRSAWDAFRANKRLHTRQGITPAEMRVLQHISTLGAVRATRDYLFLLQVIRQALQEE